MCWCLPLGYLEEKSECIQDFSFIKKKKIAPFDSSAGKAEGCRGDLKKKKHTDAFSSFKQ